jgi:hypothetical protein
MKNIVVLILTLAAMGMPSVGFSASRDIDIALSKGAAHLTFAGYGELKLDLRPFSGAAAIEKAKILFVNTKDRLSYVVIQLTGPTRLRGGTGYCGAGQEENLVWMKLSSTQVLDVRAVLFNSCTFSIEPDNVNTTEDELKLKYVSYSENKNFVLAYDNKVPEKGFAVSSEQLGK